VEEEEERVSVGECVCERERGGGGQLGWTQRVRGRKNEIGRKNRLGWTQQVRE